MEIHTSIKSNKEKVTEWKFNFSYSKCLKLNLKNTVKHIYQELKFISLQKKKERIFVIFSPASASYDQFNNFEERGNQFKKLTINYARKYF